MKSFKSIVLWMAALLAIGAALICFKGDMLWKIQQYNLFLSSPLFFKQMMVVPGGMLSYIGAFFTQYFFHPWQGVLLLSCWWLLLLWLTKRTFCIPDRWCAVTLIPVAILLIANMNLGYWIYLMRLRGYFFMPTIGTTIAVALLWAFRSLPQKLWMRAMFVVLTVLVGYPLMGVYGLVAALLMAVWIWRLQKNNLQNAILSGIVLVALVAIPLVFYRFVYHETSLGDVWLAGMPGFFVSETYPVFKVPYYLLAACYLVFVVVSRGVYSQKKTEQPVVEPVSTKKKDRKKSSGQKESAKKRDWRPVVQWALQGVLFCGLAAVVWYFWYKDENFHHELRMQHCIEQTDWEGVLTEGEKVNNEPTRAIVMMNNLALSRLGRQCDEMYNFRKGSKKTNTPLPVYMYNTTGRQIYYQYGMLNECHRMCLEQGVEQGWSVELLQYLARCSMLGGETNAAQKYLRLLRQTQFYGPWADHMEQLLANRKQMGEDRETGPITHMLHYLNNKGADNGFVEQYLMQQLSVNDSDDPYFQEQAVLGAMWMRSPDDFWPRFMRYLELRPKQKIPRIIQEAVWLFGNMQEKEIIFSLPIDQSVKDSYDAFLDTWSKYEGRDGRELRGALYSHFGNTYFFEYYFLKDITYF